MGVYNNNNPLMQRHLLGNIIREVIDVSLSPPSPPFPPFFGHQILKIDLKLIFIILFLQL